MKKCNHPTGSLAIGIEIGGTKTQVGIGYTDGKLIPGGVIRKQVIPENGAEGILSDVEAMIVEILESERQKVSNIAHIGIGFGGIVDVNSGMVLKSYQINGWENFPLKKWAQEKWKKPVIIQNDAKTAGLAEALCGSGRGCSRMFYMTIGSGIGGGWIVNGKIDNGQGLGAAEVGHTWVPDPVSGSPVELEQVCSGWSIGRRARVAAEDQTTMMTKLAEGSGYIDAKVVYVAAEKGDELANRILHETCQTLSLAISNVVALLHPERVVIGGGVSLMGPIFWMMLKQEVETRVISSFASRVDIVKAELNENVVVIGALCLSRELQFQ